MDSLSEDRGFVSQLAAACEISGATVPDGLRGLRPGGPIDRIIFRLECNGCRRSERQPLREFNKRSFLCECGAPFDIRDLDKLVALLCNGVSVHRCAELIPSMKYVDPRGDQEYEAALSPNESL